MKKFAVSITEAFAGGYMIIPRITFACIISVSYHLNFILAFILLYSFEKSGVYMIQGFGIINNPYRILRYSIDMAIIGSFLCMVFTDELYFFEIGAVLIGMGLSNYASLFQTIKDRQKENNTWNYGKSRLFGYILEIVVVLSIYVFIKKLHKPAEFVFAFLFISFIIIRLTIEEIKINDTLVGEKAFIHREKSWKFFIPAILMLVTTLFVRVMKQTADPYMLTYIAIVFCIIILISFFYSKTKLSNYALQTIWFGEVRNYVFSFSLLFFIAIDKTYMLALTYAATIFSMIIAVYMEASIKKRLGDYNFNRLCIYGAVASTFLLWNFYTYIVGVFFAGIFATLGNRINIQYFKQNENIPVLERRTVTAKLHNFGGIVQQTILLSVIVSISFILYGNGAVGLQAFDMHSSGDKLDSIFIYTKYAISVILLLNSLFIVHGVKKTEESKSR